MSLFHRSTREEHTKLRHVTHTIVEHACATLCNSGSKKYGPEARRYTEKRMKIIFSL
jgi:hypothetical protein